MSETQSLCSYSSCSDSQSVRSDEIKASAASTTLRPRFGMEYKKLDRRKLADDLNMSLIDGPNTPNSPSINSSVFTFDTTSTASRMSSISAFSLGNDSPKSPSLCRGSHDHDYVNLPIRDYTDSPRFMDMTPPRSPALSGISEQSNPLLNYAEIDLSQTDDSKKPRKPASRSSQIEYAMIDMVATAAAAKVGKAHVQLREDSLRRKDRRPPDEQQGSKEYISRRTHRERTKSSSSFAKERKSSTSRSGSKDRKFSSPL